MDLRCLDMEKHGKKERSANLWNKMKKHLKTGNRLTMEQKEYHKEDRYLQAVERVKEIKGFYTHLLVYILINCMLLWLNTKGFKEPLFEIVIFIQFSSGE